MRLEKAIQVVYEETKDVTFAVTWRPFFLDPSLPMEGINKLESYEKKFGRAKVDQMVPYMKQTGLRDNVNFSYGGMLANTLNSHRVLEFALKEGGTEAQNKVVEELFQNYFEQEKNIGDESVLRNALSKGELCEDGVDGRVEELFKDPSILKDDVFQDVSRFSRKYRISGVPHFVFGSGDQDITTISGAQDSSTMAAILREIVNGIDN